MKSLAGFVMMVAGAALMTSANLDVGLWPVTRATVVSYLLCVPGWLLFMWGARLGWRKAP